ncbi:unnamed protein product, partial [marine sediment metagenome]
MRDDGYELSTETKEKISDAAKKLKTAFAKKNSLRTVPLPVIPDHCGNCDHRYNGFAYCNNNENYA